MAYVVADPCVKCKYTDCVAVCPVDCFYEGKNSLAINPDENMLLDPTLPQKTQYFSLNLAWQFSQRAMLGAEYLWGQNNDLADNSGTAQRLQVTLRYDLNP